MRAKIDKAELAAYVTEKTPFIIYDPNSTIVDEYYTYTGSGRAFSEPAHQISVVDDGRDSYQLHLRSLFGPSGVRHETTVVSYQIRLIDGQWHIHRINHNVMLRADEIDNAIIGAIRDYLAQDEATPGRPLAENARDWDAVDWSKSDAEIARLMGVARQTARWHRNKRSTGSRLSTPKEARHLMRRENELVAIVVDQDGRYLTDEFVFYSEDGFDQVVEAAREKAAAGTACAVWWTRPQDSVSAYWGPRGASFRPYWYDKQDAGKTD